MQLSGIRSDTSNAPSLVLHCKVPAGLWGGKALCGTCAATRALWDAFVYLNKRWLLDRFGYWIMTQRINVTKSSHFISDFIISTTITIINTILSLISFTLFSFPVAAPWMRTAEYDNNNNQMHILMIFTTKNLNNLEPSNNKSSQQYFIGYRPAWWKGTGCLKKNWVLWKSALANTLLLLLHLFQLCWHWYTQDIVQGVRDIP